MTTYILFHWWKGDRVSDPGWVQTDTPELRSLTTVEREIQKMRSLGWSNFKIYEKGKGLIDVI